MFNHDVPQILFPISYFLYAYIQSIIAARMFANTTRAKSPEGIVQFFAFMIAPLVTVVITVVTIGKLNSFLLNWKRG